MGPENGSSRTSKISSKSWEAQNLPPWCFNAISSLGYTEPTPVQAAVLPLFLGNSDVVVEAPTGSGKSIAFLLPLCVKILREEATKRHHVAAVIVTPTRELATQIFQVLQSLLEFHPPSAEVLPGLKSKDQEKRPATSEPVVVPQLVVGGTIKSAEDLSFFLRQSPNVLVATPGRLAELISSRHVNSTASFQMLVLDEADRLLDLGFSKDLERVLAFLPKQRRTGLFSASMNDALGALIKVSLRNPRRVIVRVKELRDDAVIEEKKTPASLTMSYLVLPPGHKIPAAMQLLEKLEPRPQRSILFFASGFSVKYFAATLPSLVPPGFSVVSLHGKMEQPARERSFSKFVGSSSPSILLTTDIASRGLDIPSVDLVLNIDPPSDPKTFIHRCGRSARAGRRGLAVTFLLPGHEEDFVPFMTVRKTPISPLVFPTINVTPEEADKASTALRKQALGDREVYNLAQRGFVSWVRSYQEHRAASIFRIADLDFVALAHAWGLLRLPRMPEVKGIDRGLGLDIDIDSIAFKDKAKEKKRLAEPAVAVETGGIGDGEVRERKRKKNEAWSGKHEREDVRVVRREKKQRRRESEREAMMTEGEKVEKRKLDELIGEVRKMNELKMREVPSQQAPTKHVSVPDEEFDGFSD